MLSPTELAICGRVFDSHIRPAPSRASWCERVIGRIRGNCASTDLTVGEEKPVRSYPHVKSSGTLGGWYLEVPRCSVLWRCHGMYDSVSGPFVHPRPHPHTSRSSSNVMASEISECNDKHTLHSRPKHPVRPLDIPPTVSVAMPPCMVMAWPTKLVGGSAERHPGRGAWAYR